MALSVRTLAWAEVHLSTSAHPLPSALLLCTRCDQLLQAPAVLTFPPWWTVLGTMSRNKSSLPWVAICQGILLQQTKCCYLVLITVPVKKQAPSPTPSFSVKTWVELKRWRNGWKCLLYRQEDPCSNAHTLCKSQMCSVIICSPCTANVRWEADLRESLDAPRPARHTQQEKLQETL